MGHLSNFSTCDPHKKSSNKAAMVREEGGSLEERRWSGVRAAADGQGMRGSVSRCYFSQRWDHRLEL